MPDCEELLDWDSKTNVARPKEECKKSRLSNRFFFQHEMQYNHFIIYRGLNFIWGFLYNCL